MPYRIVTISRMFGSGGRTIGRELSERLGIPAYDKELIEMVAQESGLHPDYVAEHGEHAPFKSHFAYAFIGSSQVSLSNEHILWEAQCRVIRDIADKGPCVIIGRCADYLLRDREDALHVFICADTAFRAHRIVHLYGETDVRPERRLDEKDQKRRVNYDHFTGRRWGDPDHYHMVLNSGRLGVERCVDLIEQVYRS